MYALNREAHPNMARLLPEEAEPHFQHSLACYDYMREHEPARLDRADAYLGRMYRGEPGVVDLSRIQDFDDFLEAIVHGGTCDHGDAHP